MKQLWRSFYNRAIKVAQLWKLRHFLNAGVQQPAFENAPTCNQRNFRPGITATDGASKPTLFENHPFREQTSLTIDQFRWHHQGEQSCNEKH